MAKCTPMYMYPYTHIAPMYMHHVPVRHHVPCTHHATRRTAREHPRTAPPWYTAYDGFWRCTGRLGVVRAHGSDTCGYWPGVSNALGASHRDWPEMYKIRQSRTCQNLHFWQNWPIRVLFGGHFGQDWPNMAKHDKTTIITVIDTAGRYAHLISPKYDILNI